MRVRTLVAASATFSAGALISLPALADCAPGEWFCDEAKEKPGQEEPSSAPPSHDQATAPAAPSAPVVNGAEPLPPVVYEPPPRAKAPPPKKKPEPTRRFGINGHANIAIGGSDPYYDAPNMIGPGAAFRFRPMSILGLDSGLELLSGRDWNGDDRLETALVVHALLFVNPGDRFELHLLSGFGLSLAYVEEREPGDDPIRHYWYFGWDLGIGFEWYLSKRVTLGFEALWFIRGREDKGDDHPEFVDPSTRRATNTSTGGLLRPGVTYYF